MATLSAGTTRIALAVCAVAALGGAYVALRSTSAPEPAAAPEPASEAAVPDAAPPAAAAAPSLDLVRVEPDGSAVVAGRAAPGARVTIYAEDVPLAEAEADASGAFVAVFRAPPGATPRALTLEAEDSAGARAAGAEVVMLPPAPAATPTAAPAPAVTEAGPQAETGPGAAPEDDTPGTGTAAQPPAPEGSATEGAVEATPSGDAEGLTLASISYGETGLVTLAGRGDAGTTVRAYVDDRLTRDAEVGADGRWTLELDDLAPGLHRLRIDALRADGTVANRLDTPIQRDLPAPTAPGAPGAPPTSVTVQPGNNLWSLARAHYGSGMRYGDIYTANRELIADPKLIYPGQIFVLPEAAAAD